MAQGESSAAASSCPAGTGADNQLLKNVLTIADQMTKIKARSLDTARHHLATVEHRGHDVRVALLGDSMIERMSTTGQWETLQSWPSETMLALNAAAGDNADSFARQQGVANFGCGGDKIENILFRVLGDQEKDLKGLGFALHPPKEAGDITNPRNHKLWVIHGGTNNLNPKKGLSDKSLFAMDTLIRTLHAVSRPGTKFLLTGLFYRTDVPNELVDGANAELKSLVGKLQHELLDAPQPTGQSHNGKGKAPASHKKSDSAISEVGDLSHTFDFLPAPQMDESGGWLDDHVHLNQEGYRKWMQTLLPKVNQMLHRPPPPPNNPKPHSPGFPDKTETPSSHSTRPANAGQENSL